MVKFTDDINQIAEIWIEAFGDSFEDIKFFADNLSNGKCLGYFTDSKLVSMLYLIDCNLDGKPNKYVYAACTLREFRGNGYMKSLLDYIKENYNNVCLIPANESLISYYQNNDLTQFSSVNNLIFDECADLVEDYLYEGCELKNPIVQFYKGE